HLGHSTQDNDDRGHRLERGDDLPAPPHLTDPTRRSKALDDRRLEVLAEREVLKCEQRGVEHEANLPRLDASLLPVSALGGRRKRCVRPVLTTGRAAPSVSARGELIESRLQRLRE